ncbi:puromycin-sensitive aminopeptidase-like protein isoform X2 [Tanacetum coccineum]
MHKFYTVTVYEKEAEVVRMYKTLLGSEGFRKGTDLYFQRHEGKAVTCEDFFAAIQLGHAFWVESGLNVSNVPVTRLGFKGTLSRAKSRE